MFSRRDPLQANQLWKGARFRRTGGNATFQVVKIKQNEGAPIAEDIWAVTVCHRKLFGLITLGWTVADQASVQINPKEEVETV